MLSTVLGNLRTQAAVFLFALAAAFLIGGGPSPDGLGPTAAYAQTGGEVPGNTLGSNADSEMWRAVREGTMGRVSIPDQNAALLIQSDGEEFRAIRNGPLANYKIYAIFGMVFLLALFFALRGRIRIEAGPSGDTIQRFNGVERFAHWLVAVTFILLAITGLNLQFGRYFLPDVMGAEAFASMSAAAKWVHNWIAFAFMAGLVLIFVLWVRHNIPNKDDLVWLAHGGGLFTTGDHPPSRKFNAGQKMIFWLVILGGASLSLSGWALLNPFDTTMWQSTLQIFDSDVVVTPMQEMQYSVIWHATMSGVMIAIILAHIYIGSVGMEGAFAAMGSGHVDKNWAKEHHGLWVEEVEGQAKPAPAGGD